MTTTCPFCGAANDDSLAGHVQSFQCGTLAFTGSMNRDDQTPQCITSEVARLTKERDEARAEVDRLKAGGCARDQRTTQFCAEAVALQERVKRLKEAGDEIIWAFCPASVSMMTERESDALKCWNKAKEAKP